MTAWMSRGLCAEEASSDQSIAEMFFPDPGGFRDAADARAICRRCEVQVDCLRFAMEQAVEGIWGGTTAKQRQEMRRNAGATLRPGNTAKPINHGTEAGARQHRRRGEKPCELCRDAALLERRYREAAR